MLRDEDGMTSEWRLVAVIRMPRRREALFNKITRKPQHGRQALRVKIGAFAR